MSEFFDIRGQFEKYRIGSKSAADSPMPECVSADKTPMPESDIKSKTKPMPISAIKIGKPYIDPSNPGCLGLIFGFRRKS